MLENKKPVISLQIRCQKLINENELVAEHVCDSRPTWSKQ